MDLCLRQHAPLHTVLQDAWVRTQACMLLSCFRDYTNYFRRCGYQVGHPEPYSLPWHVTYLIGPGPCEAAKSPGPTHGSLQLVALGCGTGVHPYWAVADGKTVLEKTVEVQASVPPPTAGNPAAGCHPVCHTRKTLWISPL